jgi:hypothetical protein
MDIRLKIIAEGIEARALTQHVDIGPPAADLVGWTRRAVERLEEEFARRDDEQRRAMWGLLEAARAFRGLVCGRIPAVHRGHRFVEGWLDRDREAAIAGQLACVAALPE